MKLKSVKKELKEALQNSLLTTAEWEVLVEESKTNKELEGKLNEAQEQFKSITDGNYESDDFVTSVKSLNGAVDFAEVLRGWDIVEKIREYQDIYKMGYVFKDEYFVSPIPLVLVNLDPERILMKRPEKWYENNKDNLVKLLDKLIMRENLKSGKSVTKEPLKDFISRNSLEKYPKILCYYMQKEGVFSRQDGFEKALKPYQKYISKKFDKTILEHNPNLKKFTYASMVKDYFGLVLDESQNAPKLAKQLKKAGISYTDKEIQHFGEVKNWWEDWNYKNYSTMGNDLFRVRDLWVDYADFEIPTLVDKWAFNGSCNSQGNCGQATSYVLNTLEEARYCYIYDTWDEPIARFYYVQDCNGVLGVADLYCENGHGYYLAPQILLCVAYGKRLSDFVKYENKIVYMTNDSGYWSNLSADSYSHYVTGEIEPIEPYGGVINDFNKSIGQVWSENLERYIATDNSDFVYCSNIEDYEWNDEVYICDHCEESLSPRGDYFEVSDGTIFCSEDCATHQYIYADYESDYIDRDYACFCPDCGCVFHDENGAWGEDGEYYCPDCVEDHEEEGEE